jgi:hypothetical protein
MAYNPNLTFRYDGLVIEPAPNISVTKEPIYIGGNENLIGFTYKVDLTGYASSVMHSSNNSISNMPKSLTALDAIKYILHRNGKTLNIYDNCKGQDYLTASGGKLVSFSAEEGNWYNYVKYKASLEFSELGFYSSYYGWSQGVSADTLASQDNTLNQLMYSLKNYTDNWNFTVPENEAYMYYTRIAYVDSSNEPAVSAEDYSQIQVSYTINATGKNYYNTANTAMSAWEMAKQFVQYKMYHQIAMFRNGGLLSETPFVNTQYNSFDQGNYANQAITSNVGFQILPATPPILDYSIVNKYAIYNETIDCSTSESEGTFSATYNCILKRFDPYIAAPQNSTHTFSMSYNQTRDFKSQNRTLSINGSLQGMLKTNILANFNDGQTFILPQNGTFYNIGNDTVTKFGNAYEDFVNYIANTSVDDLRQNFKYVLGINYENLFPATDQNIPCIRDKGYNFLYQVLAEPKDFTVSYNYSAGTVDYTATYDTERACAAERGFSSMTISEEDAVPIYAEHVIVGRTRGTLHQNLNTNRAKTITISFEGVTNKTCGSGNPFSVRPDDIADAGFDGISKDPCDTDSYTSLPNSVKLIYTMTEFGAIAIGRRLILKSSSTTYNPADGSYNVSRTYLVTPKQPNNNVCPDDNQEGN